MSTVNKRFSVNLVDDKFRSNLDLIVDYEACFNLSPGRDQYQRLTTFGTYLKCSYYFNSKIKKIKIR